MGANGEPTNKAHLVEGTAQDGRVTSRVETIVEILSPLPMEEVPIVPCIGLNYRAHAAESKMPIPEFPVLFYKPKTSVAGPVGWTLCTLSRVCCNALTHTHTRYRSLADRETSTSPPP